MVLLPQVVQPMHTYLFVYKHYWEYLTSGVIRLPENVISCSATLYHIEVDWSTIILLFCR